MKVLLIEDHPGTRTAVDLLLQAAGHAVRAVESAEEAVRVLAAERFDLLIVDLMLPGMQGEEFIERYHALAGTARIIVLTGKDLRGVTLPPGSVLTSLKKPVTQLEVLGAVSRAEELALKDRRLADQVRANRDEIQACTRLFEKLSEEEP